MPIVQILSKINHCCQMCRFWVKLINANCADQNSCFSSFWRAWFCSCGRPHHRGIGGRCRCQCGMPITTRWNWWLVILVIGVIGDIGDWWYWGKMQMPVWNVHHSQVILVIGDLWLGDWWYWWYWWYWWLVIGDIGDIGDWRYQWLAILEENAVANVECPLLPG